ncbi:hypothetical protein GCM10009527_037000 [Actinomadura nitritigenes]|uniref:DUF7064 domain-containing protein n=1 Tax=Actinomadura nitritigenes TaxID=134602 RepID=A0ABS3QRM5_9ACTN|nr:hypothetical protein [Actinomadura nitritigenes]MBO2436561.1 hypothetical protein [Actinomadura nitritigenes]
MAKVIDHGTWQLTPADEGLHEPGSEVLWNESYYFDFAAPDGSVAGYVRLGLYPNWDRAWYWACVTGKDRPLVLIADNDAPLPKPGTTDVRTGAYEATQTIAEPFGPVRIGLDGEAAILPDPTAAYGDTSGAETTRLTFDLRWDTVGGVYPYKDIPRYEIPCTVSGTVTVGDEALAVDAPGERDHSWGERDWWKTSWLWSSGRLGDGTFFHCMQANIGFAIPWPSFAVPPGGEIEHRDGFSAETRFAADDLPESSHLRVPGVPMTATPLAFAPVAVVSPDGRTAHFPRALCRFEAEDGRTGHGWTEWHQPPGWRDHGWSYLAEGGAR